MHALQTYEEDLLLAQAVLNKDQQVTRALFYVNGRGMLTAVIKKVFDYEVEYDELVNALYLYIMENDGYRLRQYQGRSTIYLWLRTTATRFFIQYRDQVIEDTTHEPRIQHIYVQLTKLPKHSDYIGCVYLHNLNIFCIIAR